MVAAMTLIALGAAGIVMPLVPGVPLMVAGIGMLGPIFRTGMGGIARGRAGGNESL